MYIKNLHKKPKEEKHETIFKIFSNNLICILINEQSILKKK